MEEKEEKGEEEGKTKKDREDTEEEKEKKEKSWNEKRKRKEKKKPGVWKYRDSHKQNMKETCNQKNENRKARDKCVRKNDGNRKK